MSELCNAGKQYGLTVRVPREIDLRRFPALPRATKKFERSYRRRTPVERVNARLKIFWGADDDLGSDKAEPDCPGFVWESEATASASPSPSGHAGAPGTFEVPRIRERPGESSPPGQAPADGHSEAVGASGSNRLIREPLPWTRPAPCGPSGPPTTGCPDASRSIADHRANPGPHPQFFLPFRLTETGRVPTSHSGIGEKRWSARRCLVLGAWCLVLGAWWFLTPDSWFLVPGS